MEVIDNASDLIAFFDEDEMPKKKDAILDLRMFSDFLLKQNGTIVLIDDLAKEGKDILFYFTEIKDHPYVEVDAKDLKGVEGKKLLLEALKEAEEEKKLFFLDNALDLPNSSEREEIANILFYVLKGEYIEGVNPEEFPVLIAEVPTEKPFDYTEGRLRDFTHLICNKIEGLEITCNKSSITICETSKDRMSGKVFHVDFIAPLNSPKNM